MTETSALLRTIIDQHPNTPQGKPRRMGVEIELAGLKGKQIVELLQKHFGGEIDWLTPFEIELNETEFGTFKVELDSEAIKDIGTDSGLEGDPENTETTLQSTIVDAVGVVAEALVPWEIVSPPIELEALPKLYPLIDELREAGALGTRHAPHYAFGIHLNPELPSHDPLKIRDYLRAFAVLYDWIRATENTDLSRRITPYINHFEKPWLSLILEHDYEPDLARLIDDYLEHNPTRNRSLDMLPLFKELDRERVEAVIDDTRVNARPTFHYRLPNCDIDNPDWNLSDSVDTWLQVEALAYSPKLAQLAEQYHRLLNGQEHNIDQTWSNHVAAELSLQKPIVE